MSKASEIFADTFSLVAGLAATANRHPADRLASIRAEIKRLEILEEEARNQLLSNPDDLAGDEYEANIRTKQYQKTDTKALKRAYPEIASQFMTEHTMTTVWLRSRSEPDELGQ